MYFRNCHYINTFTNGLYNENIAILSLLNTTQKPQHSFKKKLWRRLSGVSSGWKATAI